MKKIIFIINFTILLSHPVIKDINIQDFMGRWYVISLIPNWIEEGGTNSFDDYKLNSDGTIDITYKTIKNGKEKIIKQKGTIINEDFKGRWEIEFIKPWIPFYKAPYEVVLLDENYEYMVVGYPDNSFGWIMSRETSMDNNLYNEILDVLNKDFGYLKTEFQKVRHDK